MTSPDASTAPVDPTTTDAWAELAGTTPEAAENEYVATVNGLLARE